MSLHAMPMVIVNLGCEMLFILEQRLMAQNIPLDKSTRCVLAARALSWAHCQPSHCLPACLQGAARRDADHVR